MGRLNRTLSPASNQYGYYTNNSKLLVDTLMEPFPPDSVKLENGFKNYSNALVTESSLGTWSIWTP